MIKCCNQTPSIRMLYRYKVSTINCKQCNKMWDVHIPEHIPYDQYSNYVDKKYNQLIVKEEKIISNLLKGIRNG